MSDQPAAGDKPAGTPVPENKPSRFGELEGIAKADAKAVESFLKRVEDGIEAWYAKHYHKAAASGSQPISASDKASLIQHVQDAAKTTPQE